jgi:hypothetical protein
MRVVGGLLTLACAAGACVDVAEHRGTDPAPEAPDAGVPVVDQPITRHPGATVRVEANRARSGFGGFAAVWIHHEDGQDERLAIERDGRFDWIIDRNGTKCQIAGTVTVENIHYHDADAPALTWNMQVNNCNSSYQGKTASDVIVEHTFDHLVIKDAEFELAPVPYDRQN